VTQGGLDSLGQGCPNLKTAASPAPPSEVGIGTRAVACRTREGGKLHNQARAAMATAVNFCTF